MCFKYAYSEFRPIRAVVLLQSVLSQLMYSNHTANILMPKGNSKETQTWIYLQTIPQYSHVTPPTRKQLICCRKTWMISENRRVLMGLNWMLQSLEIRGFLTFRNHVHTSTNLTRQEIPESNRARTGPLIVTFKLKYREHKLLKSRLYKTYKNYTDSLVGLMVKFFISSCRLSLLVFIYFFHF